MSGKTLSVNLIAKDNMSGPMKVIAVNSGAMGDSIEKSATGGTAGMKDLSAAAEQTAESLEGSALAAGAFGTAIMSALVVPIGMGTKAAWDQVGAVEQATLAFRAYETDVGKVNAVLEELITYAQSDLGRLFSRQDLFEAAQGLKVAGAETQNLAGYVEILGRSVSIGLGTWDELIRVIGRVGTTGRLAGEDFEMLQKMGFQLDASLRNQTISWDELFTVLDAGIIQVSGQTETIRGQMVQTETSVRSLGLAFLQVDADTSTFADGGLGSLAMDTLPTVRDVLASMIPIAEAAGGALAFLGGGAQLAAEGFLALPQGLQTTIFSIVGGFGALAVGASVTVLAFSKLSAAGAATIATFRALGAVVARHPILFIASVVGGVALSAWARHRNAVDDAKQAYENLQTEIETTDQIIRDMRLGGFGQTADMMEAMRHDVRVGFDQINSDAEKYSTDFMNALFGDQSHTRGEAGVIVKDFLDSTVGQAALDWASANDKEYADTIMTVLGMGDSEQIAQLTPFVKTMMSDYYAAFEMDDTQKAAVEDSLNDIFELMKDPNVDASAIFTQWDTAVDKYARTGNLDGFKADLAAIEDGAVSSTAAIIAMRESTDFLIELSGMRLAGNGSLADDMMILNSIMGEVAGSSEKTGMWFDFLMDQVKSGNIDIGGMTKELSALTVALDLNVITQEQYDGAVEQLILRHVAGAESANLMADAVTSMGDVALASATGAIEEYNQHIEVVTDNLQRLMEVSGFGGLAGAATDMHAFALEANRAGDALDTVFRVTVGNTDAIASQAQGIHDWALELIGVQGEYSKLDELVQAGRITGQSGVFDDNSEYAQAQRAYNDILRESTEIQEHMLVIQAMQAPLIRDQIVAQEDYWQLVADMPAEQQLITLGWMDSAAAAQAMEFQTLAVAAATGQLGENGEAVFTSMITGAANADPVLKALLIDMGLISEGADGTISVNLDGAEGAQSEIRTLTDTVAYLIDLLDDGTINGSFYLSADDDASPVIRTAWDLLEDADGSSATMTLALNDGASAGISAAQVALWALDGQVATSTIRTVYENRGIGPAQALGGIVNEYATGGVIFRAGEIGPEVAHFAGGGTALIPRDGFYSAPAGTYISPNNSVSNSSSYGGDTFNITVNGADAEYVKTVVVEHVVPPLIAVMDERRRAAGL